MRWFIDNRSELEKKQPFIKALNRLTSSLEVTACA
jgi:hypothetical protein